jgi:predicted outer membrane repeat protein
MSLTGLILTAGCSDPGNPVSADTPVITDRDLWYVNANAPSNGNGSSWDRAFRSVQEAVNYASEGDAIWVSSGRYTSSRSSDPSVPVLSMKNGVDVYGGFSTADTSFSQRDPFLNVTILDGENRVWHVVVGAGPARLDGFTIMSGSAEGDFPDNCGGGMLNHHDSPHVENCIFTSNDAAFHGAGMANLHASPTVINCTFRLNTAMYNGGGVYNDDENGIAGHPRFEECRFGPANTCRFGAGMYNSWCAVTIDNCGFANNLANHNGGGIYNTSSRVTARSCSFSENRAYSGGAVYMNGISGADSTRMENCLVSSNMAYVSGGGVYLLRSSSSILNCTIAGNDAVYGGGISCWHSEAEFFNCIVWGNTALVTYPAVQIGTEIVPQIRHCDIDQAGYGTALGGAADAYGNIRIDPLFVTGPDGEYYLSQTAAGQLEESPCADSGMTVDITSWLTGLMTTRTDHVPDTGAPDMGFHYLP